LDLPFFSVLAYAMEKTLYGQGYRAFMCSFEEDEAKESAYINMMIQQRIDGLILVPMGQSANNISRLTETGTPLVLVDRDLEGVDISQVLADNRGGGYAATQHLLSLGHERIGVICPPMHSHPIVMRLEGYRQALAESGQTPYQPPLISTVAVYGFEEGYQAALELLQGPEHITAIFALTDVLALGAIKAAHTLGLSVPQDISIVGFDDVPVASYSSPALTTIAQPITKMGENAVQLLLEQIRTGSRSSTRLVLPTEMVVRQSAGEARERSTA
jgi:LacI family transcriptional regulator